MFQLFQPQAWAESEEPFLRVQSEQEEKNKVHLPPSWQEMLLQIQ